MKLKSVLFLATSFVALPATPAFAAETAPSVPVVDGIVQPRRPIAAALTDAMQFLRRADGSYVPGHIDGDLAGYFLSAFVQPDGSRATRQLFFPARQHGYFIRTFLNYYTYTGEREWLLRAKDLAEWNIAHSTPADAAYPNLPYSAYEKGKPTGSADKNSIETDKPAFFASGYLRLFEITGENRYLEAAQKIATTLVAHQNADGSWPFRVIAEDGKVFQELGGAPVFFVEFFEQLLRHDARAEYRRALEKAARLMIARNVEEGAWGTYHEDVKPHDGSHIGAEPMSFTAAYLFSHAAAHPEYIEMGKKVLRQMEATLVHTKGHAAAPAPAVAEQTNYVHIMPGHTARYCWALSDLYAATHDDAVRKRALSGLNADTYMQNDQGLFITYFYDVKKQTDNEAGRPNWYSQHLYTVCHVLECMAALPEIVPNGETHVLGASNGLSDLQYAKGRVHYASAAPTTVTMKLAFTPKHVTVGGQTLESRRGRKLESDGWHFDSATHVLTARHGAGAVDVTP